MVRDKTVKKHFLENPDFWKNLIGIFILLLILAGFGIFIYDIVYLDPMRAEIAQQSCLEQGYDIYTGYRGVLRDYPLGVKCTYVDYERKSIDINSENVSAGTLILS